MKKIIMIVQERIGKGKTKTKKEFEIKLGKIDYKFKYDFEFEVVEIEDGKPKLKFSYLGFTKEIATLDKKSPFIISQGDFDYSILIKFKVK